MWRQDNPQVGRRAITYPPPTPHTLSPLLYVIFPPEPGEEGRQRWERAGLEVGLAYIPEYGGCFGKILWPEITCHVCSSVWICHSTDAVGEPGGGGEGEGTAEAGWFLAIVGSPLEIRGQVVDPRGCACGVDSPNPRGSLDLVDVL